MEDYIDITPIEKTEITLAKEVNGIIEKVDIKGKAKSDPKLINGLVRDVDSVCYDCPNLYVKQSGRINGVPYEQCECTLMSSPVRPSFYSWDWMWDSNEHDNRKPFDMLVKYKCPNIQIFREKMTAVRLPPKKG